MSAEFNWVSLVLVALAGLPAESAAQPGRPVVRVMIQNDAGVPTEILTRARVEVGRLFDLIDIEISWVTEVPEGGGRLRVVSLTTWEPSGRKVAPSVLGYTQAGEGKRGIRAYVFWRRVELASQTFGASLDKLLAVAIAHELGHMLLPDGGHANAGLMDGPWDANHFRSASAGLLAFSRDSARLIRREVEQEVATVRAAGDSPRR